MSGPVLLTLTTTQRPATDLGFLLHKHPDRLQTFDVPFGAAHVFYPEATEDRCTAALLLEIGPVGLVRRGAGRGTFALAEYVNDRPYVASSFLSVAMNGVFKTAMTGTCRARPAIAAAPMALEAWVPAVPARGGAALVRRIFEPLGYAVDASPLQLDPARPQWGEGRHLALRLTAQVRLADLLNHLLRGDRRRRRVDACARRGGAQAQARAAARRPAPAHPAPAEPSDVPRQAPDRVRRRGARRGDRAPRPGAARGRGAERVRVGATRHRGRHDAERRVQRPLGDAARRRAPPPGSPVRVDRAEFRAWAEAVGARHGYAVRFLPVGPEDPEVGAPTQMGVFER